MKIPRVVLTLSALLAFASSALATLTVSTANQNNATAFTPTWTVATDSLIAGMSPTTEVGNFVNESAGGTPKLTDGAIGPVSAAAGFTSLFATAGNSGGGTLLVYTLPASARGYSLTNITVYSGWGNGGRHAQAYTILYSTVADPGSFKVLGSVTYTGGFTGNNPGQPSANQVIWTDSTGGPIADNVAAIEFAFDVPIAPNGENGYTGYSEITVQGTPSTSVVAPVVSITTSNQNGASPFTPTWTLETPSLIAGMLPSSQAGNFNLENQLNSITRDVASLTTNGDQTITLLPAGTGFGPTTSPNYVTCGGGSGSGSSLVYTLTNSPNGSDVTNIVVYSGWADSGRFGQYYTLFYSTVSAPTTFIPITTVHYLPPVPGGTPVANRVAIAMNNGSPLASAVGSIKFDFSAPPSSGNFNNGYQGYSQIIVQGSNTAAPPPPPSPYLTQDTLPGSAANVVGDQVVFTAAYSNSPPASLQWQKIASGATNDVPGATAPTLTLNNLQVSDSGSYQLKAVNATNNSAAPSYSSARPLTVTSVPAPVNGVIAKFAAQTGLGSGVFIPTWIVTTNNSLIAGQSPSSVGSGDFSLEVVGRTVDSLTDGGNGALSIIQGTTGNTTSTNYVSCGVNPAGLSITYTLPVSAAGYDITNIMVYGGWADAGRNEQKYNVYYSTVAAPASFITLGSVDYVPSDPANAQSATRVTLVSSGTALAQNVAAVMFDFNLQGAPPKNNWEGYSQIFVAGKPSAGAPILVQDITPLHASDVVGSQVTLSAAFSGATGYQWQKDGADILGATTPTLTLSNLKLTDTATNSGYRLVASNGAGSSSTRACALTVIPVPAATANGVVVDIAAQTSDAQSFGPTWTVASGSLIANQSPSSAGTGNFYDPDPNPISHNLAGGFPALTDGTFGSVDNTGPHMSFATCGASAGQFVVYPLDTSVFVNGYTLTNIMVGAGWNDGGRDQQAYSVYYTTVENPLFSLLASVNYNPANPDNIKSFSRATLISPSGVLVSNVTAVMIDFTAPSGENGYSGYDEIGVYGVPSAAAPADGITTTVENQNTDAPSWIVETNSLIEGKLPSSVGAGNFAVEAGVGGLPVLTDGTFGPFGLGMTNFATCGGANGAGSSVTYTSLTGWDLTNIVVYSGWGNFNRDGQFYVVSYSTFADPATFLPLASVYYNPPDLGGPAANRVAIARLNGAPLATKVAAVKFDFTLQSGGLDNGYSGYAEIVLQGSSLPGFTASYVSGANLILTGVGTPGSSYVLLTSPDVAAPVTAWTTNVTGVFNGAGVFSNAIPIAASPSAHFFRLRTP